MNEILPTAVGLVAVASLVVNYLLLREIHDPKVIVYAVADKKRPSVLNLVIKNIGKGVALDVTFKSSEPIPGNAFGIENAPIPDAMITGPFVSGIPMRKLPRQADNSKVELLTSC